MAAAGVDLHYPLTRLAIIGFSRVAPHLAEFFKLARRSEVYFRTARPDALATCLGWCRKGPVVLLTAARDPAHSQAAVLRDILREHLEQA